MLIKKLRLQKGWSQQQLAQMSGLSKRTIQRIEKGTPPSVESAKSLAAVFEIDFLTLKTALTTNPATQEEQMTDDIDNPQAQPSLSVSPEEKRAFEAVKKIKKFYYSVMVFLLVIPLLAIVNWVVTPHDWWVLWVVFGWGLGLAIKAIITFGKYSFLDEKWEKRQIEKRLNRKL